MLRKKLLLLSALCGAVIGASSLQLKKLVGGIAGFAPDRALLSHREFLVACKGDQGACMDEISNAFLNKATDAGAPSLCLPSTDFGNAVPGWLGAHSETAALPTHSGRIDAGRTGWMPARPPLQTGG